MEKSPCGYVELGRAPSYDSEISSLESSTIIRRLPLVNILEKGDFSYSPVSNHMISLE